MKIKNYLTENKVFESDELIFGLSSLDRTDKTFTLMKKGKMSLEKMKIQLIFSSCQSSTKLRLQWTQTNPLASYWIPLLMSLSIIFVRVID